MLLAGCGAAGAPGPADAAPPPADAALPPPGDAGAPAADAAADLAPARPPNPTCHAPPHPVLAGLDGLPLHLGETGCFEPGDPTRPLPALVPYRVREALWSDGAEKDRWLALKDGDRLHIERDGDLTVPPGGVLIKTFRDVFSQRRIETRFYVHHEDGQWSGYTYEWNDAGTDATLLDEGSHRKKVGAQEWHLPSRAECNTCHTPAAGYTLGLELPQLDYDERSRLSDLGVFDGPTPTVGLLNEDIRPQSRARAYLHANCSGCHRPGVGNAGTIDLRYSTPLAATAACGAEPLKGTLGLGADFKIIAPGQPEKSMLVVRMRELASGRMPPVASLKVDEGGLALVTRWISGLTGCD